MVVTAMVLIILRMQITGKSCIREIVGTVALRMRSHVHPVQQVHVSLFSAVVLKILEVEGRGSA